MNDFFVFDSKNKVHKTPFGAVKCGEAVCLTAYASHTEISSVSVVLFNEYDASSSCLKCEWSGREKAFDLMSCEFVPGETPGILWYYFKIETFENGTVYFGKNGIVSEADNVQSFQITVYAKDYTTPSWFSEGVTYHVFVDRFFEGNPALTENDEYFYVHKNKSEQPLFLPNENGVVENRDIYGGNLKGVIKKLEYLRSLGVKTIYLSPIFEAWSNHKYNTANYMRIDSHFGTEETLKELCTKAAKMNIKVILDGVFSHTGSDSIYFNKSGRYGNEGAWRDINSPYRSWYDISEDGKYSSWWGIDTLPQVDELNENYLDCIIRGEDSVIAHWMRAGVSGWRLDVADELPDAFISELKKRAVQEKEDALVIGEVWEDASTKKAYGVNKKYFTDGILNGVMNYPCKNAILAFLTGEISAGKAAEEILSITENYPIPAQMGLLNIIGTHDTVRAVNALSVGSFSESSKEYRASYKLSDEEYNLGKTRLCQAAVMQYMLPGSPCIYYGDEIATQGFEDPFNRTYFNWNSEETEMLSFYKKLGEIKCSERALHSGELKIPFASGDVIVLKRKASRSRVFAIINRGSSKRYYKIPKNRSSKVILGKSKIQNDIISVLPNSYVIFKTFL